MENISIRPYLSYDSLAVARQAGQWGYNVTDVQIDDRIAAIRKQSFGEVFVAEQEEEVAGWCYVFIHFSLGSGPFADIGGLVVDEKYRRKGIATALMQVAMDWARDKDVETMRVRTAINRVEANKLYPKLGFTFSKQQNVYSVKL